MSTELLFLHGTQPLAERVPLQYALTAISGLGLVSSARLLLHAGINPERSWNQLDHSMQAHLLNVLRQDTLTLHTHPNMMNSDEGHLLGSRIQSYMVNRQRILIRQGGYRGMRHRLGKRCRGQRTRTTGRTHKILRGFQKLRKHDKA